MNLKETTREEEREEGREGTHTRKRRRRGQDCGSNELVRVYVQPRGVEGEEGCPDEERVITRCVLIRILSRGENRERPTQKEATPFSAERRDFCFPLLFSSLSLFLYQTSSSWIAE